MGLYKNQSLGAKAGALPDADYETLVQTVTKVNQPSLPTSPGPHVGPIGCGSREDLHRWERRYARGNYVCNPTPPPTRRRGCDQLVIISVACCAHSMTRLAREKAFPGRQVSAEIIHSDFVIPGAGRLRGLDICKALLASLDLQMEPSSHAPKLMEVGTKSSLSKIPPAHLMEFEVPSRPLA